MLKYNKRSIGNLYEKKAADFLREQGLLIKMQNYRCMAGEIDIIAMDGKYLVFVEVKYRKNQTLGCSLSAVDVRKQKKIIKTAKQYLFSTYGSLDIPCRFDVIGFDGKKVSWIKDAFACES